MKNKLGIISAMVLSAVLAGSAFAGVQTQDNSNTDSASMSSKKQNTTASMSGKKTRTRKHHTAKHAKKMKSSKKSTASTKK